MYSNHHRDVSTGVGLILFAMLCFAVVFAGAHVWLIAVVLQRVSEHRWVTAAFWATILFLIIYVDIRVWV